MLSRPSLASLYANWQSDVGSRLGAAGVILRRSLLGAIGAALAAAHHALYGALLAAARDSNPATAKGEALDQWVSLWLKAGRRQPTPATGTVTVSGEPGGQIDAGSLLQDAAGVEYSVDALSVVGPGGSIVVAITAVAAGLAGNQPEGAAVSFVSPGSGIDTDATVIRLSGGADRELDEPLRARMFQRIQNAPHGGNAADYEYWARSNPAVAKAWVFPLYSGLGTVRVFIAEADYDEDAPTSASSGLVDQVQDYIDTVRPVTAAIDSGGGVFVSGITVVAAERQPVDVTLTAAPDSPALRAAVEASLKSLFARDAKPEGTVRISRIREAASQASGEQDNVISIPTTNQTAAAGKILVLGTVTWL